MSNNNGSGVFVRCLECGKRHFVVLSESDPLGKDLGIMCCSCLSVIVVTRMDDIGGGQIEVETEGYLFGGQAREMLAREVREQRRN